MVKKAIYFLSVCVYKDYLFYGTRNEKEKVDQII